MQTLYSFLALLFATVVLNVLSEVLRPKFPKASAAIDAITPLAVTALRAAAAGLPAHVFARRKNPLSMGAFVAVRDVKKGELGEFRSNNLLALCFVFVCSVLAGFCASLLTACTSTARQTAVDVVFTTECNALALDQQDEPANVKLACQTLQNGAPVGATFIVRRAKPNTPAK